MASRTDILNYLRYCLSHITTDPDENTAIVSTILGQRSLATQLGISLYTQDNRLIIVNQTEEGVVTRLEITFPGLFYDSATVTFDSPGKVTAQGEALLSGDGVDSIEITQPGGRYFGIIYLLSQLGAILETQSGAGIIDNSGDPTETLAPRITITGDGVGANAYATVNAWGAVTSVVVDNAGSGYTTAPLVQFEAPEIAIEPARATASIRRGIVSTIDLDFGSQQYLFVPNCIISPSSIIFNSRVAQAHRNYRYLSDINDFPTITMGGIQSERIDHMGDRRVIKTLNQSIRGYTYGDAEDSLSASENLARDIETVIDRFADMASNLSVFDARVTQVTTDEGLMSPYGLCDLQVQISYEDTL
jgi:hypothetical protein